MNIWLSEEQGERIKHRNGSIRENHRKETVLRSWSLFLVPQLQTSAKPVLILLLQLLMFKQKARQGGLTDVC